MLAAILVLVLDPGFVLVFLFNFKFFFFLCFCSNENKGMKFALLEIKLALVKLLKSYNVNSCDNTPDRLEFDEGFLARRPKQSIPVKITKRN